MIDIIERGSTEIPFYLQKLTPRDYDELLILCGPHGPLRKSERLRSWCLEWFGIEQQRRHELDLGEAIVGAVRPRLPIREWTTGDLLLALRAISAAQAAIPAANVGQLLFAVSIVAINEVERRIAP